MKNIGRIIQKFSKHYWTKDSILIESFFDSMKTWLDIYEKGWKSRKNNNSNQPVDKESRPLRTFNINWLLLKGGRRGGLEQMEDVTLLLVNRACEAHFFHILFPSYPVLASFWLFLQKQLGCPPAKLYLIHYRHWLTNWAIFQFLKCRIP